jgi:hypothetical protein
MGVTIAFPKYEEAKRIVRALKIASSVEYRASYPKGVLPAKPNSYYKESWKDWKDFLGNPQLRSRALLSPEVFEQASAMSFTEAREIARALKLEGQKAYIQWKKTSKGQKTPLFANPFSYYKSDWTNWPDYLGSSRDRYNRGRDFCSYAEAQGIIKNLNICSNAQFRELMKTEARPMNIPTNPDKYYDEWVSWKQFLATEHIIPSRRGEPPNERPNLELLSEWALANRVTSGNQWTLRWPKHFVSRPEQIYKDIWPGWPVFLKLVAFTKIESLIYKHQVTSQKAWSKLYKSNSLPLGVPLALRVYPEWKGWARYAPPTGSCLTCKLQPKAVEFMPPDPVHNINS